MYEILFSLSAKKQLKKLDKNIQIRIIKVLERIRIRPEIKVTLFSSLDNIYSGLVCISKGGELS